LSNLGRPALAISAGTVSEGRSNPSAAIAVASLWILIPFLVVIPVGPTMPAARVVGGMTVGLVIFLLEGLAVAFAIYRRDRPLLGSAVMLVLISAIVLGFAAAQKLEMLNWIWSFYVLAPVAFAASALFVPAIGAGTRDWLRFGSIDWNVGKRIALVVAMMYVIMLGGVVLFHFDMTHQPLIRSGLPLIALVFVGIAIAAVNAGAEEFVYRGLVMQSLDEGIGAGWSSLILQAVAFGTFHFNSTEPGLTGIAGAALFGLLLGWLRRSSRGMLAPYVAHISVDLLIWTIGLVQLKALV
jgi:membrane protease YdiL (CAAX protease family)